MPASLELPVTQRFVYDDEPKSADTVEFRLVYDGRLPAQTRGNARTDDKHRIRKVFHKQLAELCKTHPGLSRFHLVGGSFAHFRRDPFLFAPLISRDVGGAYAALDILFLRRDHPGSILTPHGDLDNRIKVLFDALKIPKNANELAEDETPDEDENPFYCLLDDDSLITSVNITTDRLLTPFAGDFKHPLSDTILVIHVKTGVFYWQNHSETFM